jgi:hypothetical protein
MQGVSEDLKEVRKSTKTQNAKQDSLDEIANVILYVKEPSGKTHQVGYSQLESGAEPLTLEKAANLNYHDTVRYMGRSSDEKGGLKQGEFYFVQSVCRMTKSYMETMRRHSKEIEKVKTLTKL